MNDEYRLRDCYLVYIPYTLDRSTGPRPQKKAGAKEKKHASTRDGEAEKRERKSKKDEERWEKIKTLASK